MSAHSPVDRREPPDLDSTQTMRALTPSELYDSQQQQWYVVQLVISERPVNLDTMPRLEVFASHRLYAVTGKQDNAPRYALRLGFFPDEKSAEVICGYLRTFFSSPSIVRVSAAEQARFAQPAASRAAAVQQPASSRPPAPATATARPSQGAVQKSVAANKGAKPVPRQTKTSGSQRPVSRTKTLAEQLLDEARQVQLSRSGKNRIPEQSRSWLSRLFDAPKR